MCGMLILCSFFFWLCHLPWSSNGTCCNVRSAFPNAYVHNCRTFFFFAFFLALLFPFVPLNIFKFTRNMSWILSEMITWKSHKYIKKILLLAPFCFMLFEYFFHRIKPIVPIYSIRQQRRKQKKNTNKWKLALNNMMGIIFHTFHWPFSFIDYDSMAHAWLCRLWDEGKRRDIRNSMKPTIKYKKETNKISSNISEANNFSVFLVNLANKFIFFCC